MEENPSPSQFLSSSTTKPNQITGLLELDLARMRVQQLMMAMAMVVMSLLGVANSHGNRQECAQPTLIAQA